MFASTKKTESSVPGIVHSQSDWPFDQDKKHSNDRPPFQASVLHLHFLRNGKRILPRLDLFADQYRDFSLVLQRAAGHHNDIVFGTLKVMVLVPEGLKEIKEDADWKTAIDTLGSLDWMDGELKVLVEV